MSDLLKCPFCGGEAEVILIPNRFIDNEYIVCCSSISCAIRPKTNRFRCEKKAIETWNTRKPMEAVVAELEKASYTESADDMNPYPPSKVVSLKKAISIVRGKE